MRAAGRRLRHEAGIGEDAHRLAAAVDAVVHALPRVVAGGEHRHLCGANGKDAAGGYKAQVIVQPRQAAAEIEGRAAAGVQRDGMVLQEGGKARRVICMLMGDEDGGQVVRRQIQQSKGLLDAAGGDAGIHQQVDAAGGDQQAVALGAAGQCMYRDQSGMYLSGKMTASVAASRKGCGLSQRTLEGVCQLMWDSTSLSSGTSTMAISAPTARSLPTRSS